MVARFLSPPSGATMRGSIEVFTWSYEDQPVIDAVLEFGSRRGQSDLGSRQVLSVETTSFGGLPTDGSDLHVRLRYRTNGRWLNNDVRYVAASAANDPAIVAPVDGARLAGANQVVRWDLAGLPAEDGWLYVGSTVGAADYASVRFDPRAVATVELQDLPTEDVLGANAVIHVRLYLEVAGVWHFVDHQYQPGPSSVPTRDELTRELQALVGATPDGIIGPQTRAALDQNWVGRSDRFDLSFAERFVNDEAVVRWVQRRLNTRAGFGLVVDGVYGPATDTAVTDHLGAGGIVAVESFIELLEPGS